MFRKFALALAATAALGTASLAIGSTPAEAKKGGFHHHHHHHGHHHHWRAHRFYGPAFVSYAATGCYVKKWVATPWGYKVRWVNVCF
jgi:hypothetical protein